MDDSQVAIGETLRRLAMSHTTPKALLKAVLERHPNARKKDVAHAAFREMIEDADASSAGTLQQIGLETRALD